MRSDIRAKRITTIIKQRSFTQRNSSNPDAVPDSVLDSTVFVDTSCCAFTAFALEAFWLALFDFFEALFSSVFSVVIVPSSRGRAQDRVWLGKERKKKFGIHCAPARRIGRVSLRKIVGHISLEVSWPEINDRFTCNSDHAKRLKRCGWTVNNAVVFEAAGELRG